jgi:excisionase family DNA binding protein
LVIMKPREVTPLFSAPPLRAPRWRTAAAGVRFASHELGPIRATPETMERGERRESEKNRRSGASRSSVERARRERQLALSTGQAARYCYVTSYTIVNWIRTGKLKAQRTAGRQYRIRVEELREFLRENDMRTDLLEEEQHIRPYCWEFHCEPGEDTPVCDSCLVRRSGAENCYELRAMIPLSKCRFHECASCEYLTEFGLCRTADVNRRA